jgi:hypothetical protein
VLKAIFTIQTLLDKPNLNGVIFQKDVIENAYKNAKNAPKILNDEREILPINIRQGVELVYDKNGVHIKCVSIIDITKGKANIKDNNRCRIYKEELI